MSSVGEGPVGPAAPAADARVATDGAVDGVRPERRRRRRGGGEQPVVGEAEFRSYYGQPIINKPVWEPLDIAGYLFLGGLAGASSVTAAGATATGRPVLARNLKVVSTVAVSLSGAALVHDLGRPGRFYNMIRVFKPTSPMSVGSWLLLTFSPFSAAAAFSAVTGRVKAVGVAGTIGAAALGSLVTTYTAALICDTSVPAWRDGYRQMPFVFAASAASAAAGAGLAGAPPAETGPVRAIGVAAGLSELGLLEVMKRRMGEAGHAYTASPKGRRYERVARAATVAGVALAAGPARRSRLLSALAGGALLVGSACTRFAIFEAGIASAEDPRYTVAPQRRRLEAQRSGA